MAPTNTNERGFTLVEVLVATVILVIGLVAMAELMAITLRMQMLGKNETAAIRLIQSKMDELVAVSFTGTNAASVAVGGSLTTDVSTYNDTPAGSGFKRRWQITAIAGETTVRTLTVTIIPTVNDRRTNAQVQLSTIIRSP